MNMKHLLIATLTLTSLPSLASFNQPPKLSVDQDRIEFLGNGCSAADTFVSVNDDGSFDLLFTNLFVQSFSDAFETQACVLKFPLQVPRHTKLAISRVGVAGLADIPDPHGKGLVTLRHTLSGTVGGAAIGQFEGNELAQDVLLEKAFRPSWTQCATGEILFKTSIVVRANGENSFVSIDEGAHNGYIRYHYHLQPCH
jgi:hypothetical protein